ncbi:MAG: S16 family serine protease [Fervidicoccaceae archaeon]
MRWSTLSATLLVLLTLGAVLGDCSSPAGSASVPALAVSQTANNTLVGSVSRVDVRVLRPGSGTVYVATEPLSDVDLQASARAAAFVAAYLAGVDLFSFDYLVAVRADSPIIGGPSAGLPMSVAIFSALTNSTIRPGVVATGMIFPDGLVGPVGGVPEKVAAALEAGYKLILVPMGQSLYNKTTYVEERVGRRTVIVPTTTLVNVSQIAASRGAVVVEVATLADALRYFTGLDLTLNGSTWRPSLRGDEERLLEKYYALLSEQARGALSRASSEAIRVAKNESLRSYLEDLLSSSESFLNESEKLWDSELYYPALSYAFVSFYTSLAAENTLAAYESGDVRGFASSYIERLRSSLERYRELYSVRTRVGSMSVDEFFCLQEVYARLMDASDSLSKASSLISTSPIEAVYYASYADARMKSAGFWLELADIEREESFPVAYFDRLTAWLLSYAKTCVSYLESLQASGGSFPSIDELEERLSEAVASFEAGDVVAAMALSLEVVLDSTLSLHEIYALDLGSLVGPLKAQISLATTRSGGREPLSAKLYFQMGSSREARGDLGGAIMYYERALLILMTSGVLSQTQRDGLSVSAEILTRSPQPESVSQPSLSVAYVTLSMLVLIAAVLGLLALIERSRT